MVYVAVGNPFGDSTKRSGLNLFTDSVLALSLDDGQLQWYYQLVHHDVWDYDNGSQPILFDMEVDGAPVKALAQANKNGLLYILNRETGERCIRSSKPRCPTETNRDGEQPWPTQDSAHRGRRTDGIVPENIPPEHLEGNTIVPIFTPRGPDQIFARVRRRRQGWPTASRPGCCGRHHRSIRDGGRGGSCPLLTPRLATERSRSSKATGSPDRS